MTDEQVQQLARRLLNIHGLSHWRFSQDHARQRCGSCNYQQQEITVSRHFVKLNSAAEVQNTLLHEIAHALVGPGEGHGPRWQQVARRLGARVEATSSSVNMPEPPWLLLCRSCNQTVARRHRRTLDLSRYRCAACAHPSRRTRGESGQLQWRHVTECAAG